MSTDTLKPLLDDIVKNEIRAIVRAEMSKYNIESLARIVNWALDYQRADHKKTLDAEKTLEHFLKLVG